MDWRTISQARSKLENEEGTVHKDWGGRIPIALAYPNSYYIGMSNLGLHVVYRLLNQEPDVVCERVFWDANAHQPVSLESQRPLAEFAVVAYTIPFEIDYFNIVSMLRRARIPLSSEDRDEGHPLLVAGGACVLANPEPLAPLFDAFAIAEGEVVTAALTDALRQGLTGSRQELLRQLATIPGFYVPRFYDVEMDNDRVADIRSPADLPYPVQRQWLTDLDAYPATSVVMTEATEFGDMYLMEVTRGCARGCRFCLAGFAYLPMRERSPDILLAQAKQGLRYRRKVGLIGASLSDYSHIEELATGLRELGAEVSVSSLRVDPLPERLLQALAESGVQTLTIAPEAGSERLRRKLRKDISTGDIMRAVETAARYNFSELKLYFMVGLPSETDDDAMQIVSLLQAVRSRFPRRITVSITPFVPKAQTPLQWSAMAPLDVLNARVHYVKTNLRPAKVEVKADSSQWAQVQCVLARGDRRVGEALMTVEKKSLSSWRRALAKQGLGAELYLGSRSRDEILPWSTISAGIGAGRSRPEAALQAIR